MILLLQNNSTKNTCRVHHVELFLLSFGSGKQKHLTQKNLYRMVARWEKKHDSWESKISKGTFPGNTTLFKGYQSITMIP